MGMILILAVLASSAGEQCKQIHHTADGRVVVTTVDAGRSGSSATARSSGSHSSSSSVSVSSSSNGKSTATSSSSDGKGRRVAVTRDDTGCTITIDDRPTRE